MIYRGVVIDSVVFRVLRDSLNSINGFIIMRYHSLSILLISLKVRSLEHESMGINWQYLCNIRRGLQIAHSEMRI